MKKITLERDIKVYCSLIQATFQIYSRSDYLLAVLTHVKDEKGGATAESLSLDLFPRPKIISKKLLDICQNEGLLINEESFYDAFEDEHSSLRYSLTNEGKDALKNGRTFQKSYGIWKIYYTYNPLVPEKYRLLKFEAIDERDVNNSESIKVRYDIDSHDIDRHDVVSQGIIKLKETQLLPCFGENRNTVRIDKLEEYCTHIKSDMKVHIKWEITKEDSDMSMSEIQTVKSEQDKSDSIDESFRILGIKQNESMEEITRKYQEMVLQDHPDKNKPSNATKRFRERAKAMEIIRSNYDPIQEIHQTLKNVIHLKHPEMTYKDVWDEIMPDNVQYGNDNNVLKVSYDETTLEQRLSMQMHIDVEEPNLKKYGSFDPIHETVSIHPKKKDHAERWAKDILVNKIKERYVTKQKYEMLLNEIKLKFPTFEINKKERRDYLPSKKLGHMDSDEIQQFWHIQAMEDWNL